MRIAYLDCFAGIAGDMLLGALLDAGVPAIVLEDATAALNLGASLRIETVDRSGISSTKVHVLEDGELAEARAPLPGHGLNPQTADDDGLQQRLADETGPTPPLRTQHLHKIGHTHKHEHEFPDTPDDHAHPHVHGRSLLEIRALIHGAKLQDAVKRLAIRAFELLGQSEAKIHNVPVEAIHFHEVGAVDAIVDIVASSAGIHHLQIGAWYSSPVNVGSGMVKCAHGIFPVPAPATADLLRGLPTYAAHVQKELVTPTGAALLRALEPTFGQQPPMRVAAIGYGAGTRNPQDFPNVLRLSIGEGSLGEDDTGTARQLNTHQYPKPLVQAHDPEPLAQTHAHDEATVVTVLETALDDASPQLLAYVAELALTKGALDVMLAPVIMKKGRPGTLLTMLCRPEASTFFEQLLLRETSTLGVRIRQDRRICLARKHVAVDTPFGRIRVKLGLDGDLDGDPNGSPNGSPDGSPNGSQAGVQARNIAPEFEDCRQAALAHGVPLKQVQQLALTLYLTSQSATDRHVNPQ